MRSEIVSLDGTIAQKPGLEKELSSSKDKLDEMKTRYAKRFKVVPSNDTTAQTYAYLNRIMDASGFVKFDMLYQGPTNSKQYGFNGYNLKGETSYSSLFKFIWYLEHARLLYKIGNLTLAGDEVRDDKTGKTETIIPFTMDLDAYYSSVAGVSSEIKGSDPTFTARRSWIEFPQAPDFLRAAAES